MKPNQLYKQKKYLGKNDVFRPLVSENTKQKVQSTFKPVICDNRGYTRTFGIMSKFEGRELISSQFMSTIVTQISLLMLS